MSKKYKGKTCVYCSTPESSTTADHVIARGFFPLDMHDNLPQVPACSRCNGIKSNLEHELCTVLPFGSTNPHAPTFLEKMVAPRLEKNQKLKRKLEAGTQHEYTIANGRLVHTAMTIPFDSEKVLSLFKLIAKGLAYDHWAVLLPDTDVLSFAEYLIPVGAQWIEAMLGTRACISTGRVSLGDGIFTYQGARDPAHQTLTVWRMCLYGVETEAEYEGRSLRVSNAYVMTAPRGLKVATNVMAALGRPAAA